MSLALVVAADNLRRKSGGGDSTTTFATNNINNNSEVFVDVSSTWFDLEWVQEIETSISSSSSSSGSNGIYSVSTWYSYINTIDDHIATTRSSLSSSSSTTASTTKGAQQQSEQNISSLTLSYNAKSWVCCRALYYLPRSYKLWKLYWEFVLDQYKESNNKNNDHTATTTTTESTTVYHCFECAIQTLASYPRVWVLYIQFILSTLSSSSSSSSSASCLFSFTHLRRTINRALQSLSVAQHAKIWTIIVDAFLSSSQKRRQQPLISTTDDLPTTTTTTPLSFMPWESMQCIIRRYFQFMVASSSSSSSGTNNNNNNIQTISTLGMEYASWCESHGRYGEAATIYQTLLNMGATTATTTATAGSSSSEGTAQQEMGETRGQQQQQQEENTTQDIWEAFTQLISRHSEAVEAAGIPWELILQTAIQQQKEKLVLSQQRRNNNKEMQIIEETTTTSNSNSSNATMLGMLYGWLASAYIQRGSFEMAISVYEEGLLHVPTVRDFAILYAAYLSLTEGLLTALTDSIDDNNSTALDDDNDNENAESGDEDWDLLVPGEQHGVAGPPSSKTLLTTSTTTGNQLAEMELAMARAEHLTQRRPLLLNAVLLRQNPNDCATWIDRANLYVAQHQPRRAISALEDGLSQIRQHNSGGSRKMKSPTNTSSTTTATLSQVVQRLVLVYTESLEDVDGARDVLDRVCRQRTAAPGFTQSNDLAECWTTWIELELLHEAWDEALSLARQSVAGEPRQQQRHHPHEQRQRLNLTRTLRLWDLLLDLEDSLGTVQTTKDAYNRAIDLKVATVQHIMNFGSFLTEQKYYEESLTAYERGIDLFAFPHLGAKVLWKAYLTAFLQRYKGTKVERARNLFQRCLDDCPPEECAEFFMMYGEFEEQYGFTKRALSVYRAMCEKVLPDEKYIAYQLWIVKTIKYLGVAATRGIYEEALETLKEPSSFVKMCIDFAQTEMGLHEIDRARAIFLYGATSADPRRVPEYWKQWNDFEIAHGNEDTFREMLRMKRSVEAAFSTINYNAIGMTDAVPMLSDEEAMRMIASNEGVDLSEQKHLGGTSAVAGFVPAQKRAAPVAGLEAMEESAMAKRRKAEESVNAATDSNVATTSYENDDDAEDADEIDIDEIDAEIAEAVAEGSSIEPSFSTLPHEAVQDVITKAIPEAVFGGLSKAAPTS